MNAFASGESLPITVDPATVDGVPVFQDTRVPVQTMFDYLADGCTLEEFLDSLPTVKREDALQTLKQAAHVSKIWSDADLRILIDENLPRQLKRVLSGHAVFTVQKMGWAGIGNSELSIKAEVDFDVLLTADKSLR